MPCCILAGKISSKFADLTGQSGKKKKKNTHPMRNPNGLIDVCMYSTNVWDMGEVAVMINGYQMRKSAHYCHVVHRQDTDLCRTNMRLIQSHMCWKPLDQNHKSEISYLVQDDNVKLWSFTNHCGVYFWKASLV